MINTFYIFIVSDAIASEENLRVTPSLRSQKGSISLYEAMHDHVV